MLSGPARKATPYLNLTTLLFACIIGMYPLFFLGVIFGNLLNIFTDKSLLPVFQDSLLVWGIALWAFFREPQNLISRYKMIPVAKDNPEMMQRFMSLVERLSIKKVPEFLLIPGNNQSMIITFGTFRRQYVAISEGDLKNWEKDQSLDVIMMHEFGHIASGDLWKVNLSLKYTKWFLVTRLVMSLLVIIGGPEINFLGAIDISMALGIFLTSIFILFALRQLIQIREFAADEYVLSRTTDQLELHNALISAGVNSSFMVADYPSAFSLKKKFALRSWLLRFHPNIQDRISAINDASHLDRIIPKISFIFGLAIGQFAAYFSNVSTGHVLVGWIVLMAPFFLSSSIASLHKKTHTPDAWFLIRLILNLIMGALLPFIIQVLPHSFYGRGYINFNPILIQSPYGIPQEISFFWDIFFITLVLLPFLFFAQVWIFEYLYKTFYSSRSVLTPWLLQLPLNFGVFLCWINWMNGAKTGFYYPLMYIVLCLFWYFGFVKIRKTG